MSRGYIKSYQSYQSKQYPDLIRIILAIPRHPSLEITCLDIFNKLEL